MRHVCVDERPDLGEDTLRKLRLNSPPGGWFPASQDLFWCITKSNHPYASLFFSPQLKSISISVPRLWRISNVPLDILPAVTSIISALPTPTLQDLSVYIGCRGTPPTHFQDSLSSAIFRCGPTFAKLSTTIPLSDAAINHLVHLPHLHTWYIKNPPPSYPPSSLPATFPPLTKFTLGKGAAHGWLSLFQRLGGRDSSTQGTTPLSRAKESLESLTVEDSPDFTISAPFVSTIRMFRNLEYLNVGIHCRDGDYDTQCAFTLNNENVTELAMALPQLESLLLGYPCYKNVCATTVACLLPISVHCPRLYSLEIHFNTTNILGDLKVIAEDPRFQEVRLLPKCGLSCLDVGQMPLDLDDSGLRTVADGMMSIFPYLEQCNKPHGIWDKLNESIAELREVWVPEGHR